MVDRFKKDKLVNSQRYYESRDILSAFLDDNTQYSIEEVDNIINYFNQKEIDGRKVDEL